MHNLDRKFKIEKGIDDFLENIEIKTNIFKLVFKSILDESLSDKFLQKKGILTIDTNPDDVLISNKEHNDIYKVKTHFIIGGKEFYNVYKNPTSLDHIGIDARGVILANGDLYLSESFYPLHDEIVEFLIKNKIIDKKFNYN
jgi:dihydrofolate reductase